MNGLLAKQQRVQLAVKRGLHYTGKVARYFLDIPSTSEPAPTFCLNVPSGPVIPFSVNANDVSIFACTQHPVFAYRIIAWASKLKWHSHSTATQDVAWAELYAYSCLETHSRAPVNIDPQRKLGNINQPTHYMLRDLSLVADAISSDFGTEMSIFHSPCNSLNTKLGVKLWPAKCKHGVEALKLVGLTVPTNGLDARPTLLFPRQVHDFLHSKIVLQGRCKDRRTRRNLQFESISSRRPLQAPSKFNIHNAENFRNFCNI